MPFVKLIEVADVPPPDDEIDECDPDTRFYSCISMNSESISDEFIICDDCNFCDIDCRWNDCMLKFPLLWILELCRLLLSSSGNLDTGINKNTLSQN